VSRQRKNRSAPRSLKTPVQKHDNATNSTRSFYWRDHPVIVAAFAAAGTFTLTVFAFKEIIIPTQIADINNKIRDLPSLERNIRDLTKTNDKHLQVIDSLRRQLETLQQKDLFLAGDPVPTTINKVRIGQPISDVDKYFTTATIEKNEEYGFWSVDFGFGVIRQATYYFDEKNKERKISHVLYWLSDEMKLSDNFLHDRLVEALGQPTKSPRKDLYEWHLKQYKVYQRDAGGYSVLDSNSKPGYWPE
jgi:hypothetical protein